MQAEFSHRALNSADIAQTRPNRDPNSLQNSSALNVGQIRSAVFRPSMGPPHWLKPGQLVPNSWHKLGVGVFGGAGPKFGRSWPGSDQLCGWERRHFRNGDGSTYSASLNIAFAAWRCDPTFPSACPRRAMQRRGAYTDATVGTPYRTEDAAVVAQRSMGIEPDVALWLAGPDEARALSA